MSNAKLGGTCGNKNLSGPDPRMSSAGFVCCKNEPNYQYFSTVNFTCKRWVEEGGAGIST